jgi:hypothetical protein
MISFLIVLAKNIEEKRLDICAEKKEKSRGISLEQFSSKINLKLTEIEGLVIQKEFGKEAEVLAIHLVGTGVNFENLKQKSNGCLICNEAHGVKSANCSYRKSVIAIDFISWWMPKLTDSLFGTNSKPESE